MLAFSRTDLDVTVAFIFNCIGFKIWITRTNGLVVEICIDASMLMESDRRNMSLLNDGYCLEHKVLPVAYSSLWPEISTLMEKTLLPEVEKWRPPPPIAHKPERRSVWCQSHCCLIEIPCVYVPSKSPNGKADHHDNAQT